ncbi:Putative teichuronic acid biosynthesis glycosyltransferase TuaC [Caulifigura coniformis]|uniref:Teichuronic acid biosynthesis glycosyltransferase TuaC n=1 Tax=Caulifigura coniformis TaxID=2527983 RepID=A0A517SDR7_9PLAN|nr:glycosyltransferase family 4 protein [Caulifigura coniformis]QDT54272.1 Putative teichuronic acid biosynthesis glycosyltransferase TuaC [Caulifigura coniformis]
MDDFGFDADMAGGNDYVTGYEQFMSLSYEDLTCQQASTGGQCDYEELETGTRVGIPIERPRGRRRQIPPVRNLDRPLRIVCLGPSFQLGGVGQQTLSLARYFNPDRARITRCLVTRDDAEGHKRLAGMGIPVETATPSRLERAAEDAEIFLLWGDHFDRTLPQRRPTCVFVAHGESAWTRQGLERSRGVVDHVIAVSERVRGRVCGGFETTTILNGIDPSRLAATRPRQAVRRSLGIRRDEFLVGCVGRMTQEKQMERLISAVALLPRSFKLLLVGSGSRRTELVERASDLIPGRFVIVRPNDHLGDLYRAMDAFAFPSAHEGFGLVVAEAMACRVPVVATCVGAVPEIIENNVSGMVVDSSPEAFADAMKKLAKFPHWAAGMARQAHAFALRRLVARRMASDYETLLSRLVAAKTAAQTA